VRARIAQAVLSAVEPDERPLLAGEDLHIAPAASPAFEGRSGAGQSQLDSESTQGSLNHASPRSAVLQVLISWQASGVLELRLAAFSQTALEAWHRLAISSAVESGDSQSTSQEAITNLVDEITQSYRTSLRDRHQVLRLRLIVLAEAMAKLKLRAGTPMVIAALNRALPHSDLEGRLPIEPNHTLLVTLDSRLALNSESHVEGDAYAVTAREIHRGDSGQAQQVMSGAEPLESACSAQPETDRPPARPSIKINRGRRRKTECRIPSALPFLLLGPLSRMGYLKTLTATTEAANCLDELPLFAAALAYKVLEPPARGWRRNPAMSVAASAFAALEETPGELDLVAFARRISPHLSPLDAAISGALIAGHDPRQPLLLHRTGSDTDDGLLLVDVEGCFPISWSPGPHGLRQPLIQLDSSVVLIPQATAESELLRWMDAEGFRFITEAVPTRGERWRVLRHSEQRWSSNDEMTQEAALVRLARMMEATAEDTGALWRSLAVERPSIPLADDVMLDRHITLAASTALATMAWSLWRHREQTAPHLALERFHDLDARVCYSQDSVCVSLPLGRRFQDLRDHGLLDNVLDVPWLEGRALVFSV
jgi:hypothetical protein